MSLRFRYSMQLWHSFWLDNSTVGESRGRMGLSVVAGGALRSDQYFIAITTNKKSDAIHPYGYFKVDTPQ